MFYKGHHEITTVGVPRHVSLIFYVKFLAKHHMPFLAVSYKGVAYKPTGSFGPTSTLFTSEHPEADWQKTRNQY